MFGRTGGYDPSQDSVVRVKASEVRKRLQRFYQTEGLASAIHIELPVGTYVPRFQYTPAVTEQPNGVLTAQRRRHRFLRPLSLVFAISVLIAAGMAWNRTLHAPTPPVEELWAPMLKQNGPLLICLPVLPPTGSTAPTGCRVGLGAAYAAVHLAAFCAEHKHAYLLKMGGELNFSDLRNQAAVLLGAFSSKWTLLMNGGLRFELVRTSAEWGKIIDSWSGHQYYAENLRPDGHADADYAIAARLLDSQSGKPVFLAAGITTFGTQSAIEFLLNPASVSQLISAAPKGWSQRNFQVLISTHIIGNTPGPPKLIAAKFW